MTASSHNSFDPHDGPPKGENLGGASCDDIGQVNITNCPDKRQIPNRDAKVEFRAPMALKTLAMAKAKAKGKDLSKVMVEFLEDYVADDTGELDDRKQVRQVQKATNGQLRRTVAGLQGLFVDLHNISFVANPGSPLAREAIHAILQSIESTLKQLFAGLR